MDISRRELLKAGGVAAVSCLFSYVTGCHERQGGFLPQRNSPRPNIVWLTTDHHIYAHHYQLNADVFRLRVFEAIARDGMHFTRAYSVCPQCTPARASMLTGQYPHRHGILVNGAKEGNRAEFDADEQLFNHYLKEGGYRVGYFGKWHCGEERLPKDFGFEGFSMPSYGYTELFHSAEYKAYCERHQIKDGGVVGLWNARDADAAGKRAALAQAPFMGANKMLGDGRAHEAYCVTELADRWIRQVAVGEQPFCVKVDVWGPHFPYNVAEPFYGSIDRNVIKPYPNMFKKLPDAPKTYRECRERWHTDGAPPEEWRERLAVAYEHAMMVDDAFARIVESLKQLGIYDNTLVIYTADHGDLLGSHGELFNKGSLMVEETVKIPMAMSWPTKIKPGSSNASCVSNMDLPATILGAAGIPPPKHYDAKDLCPILAGRKDAVRDRLMLQHHGDFSLTNFQRLLLWQKYKYIAHLDDRDELFDLNSDQYEMRNLINDAQYASVLQNMRRMLLEQMDEYEDAGIQAQKLRKQMAAAGK